jgi:hypothetical protein
MTESYINNTLIEYFDLTKFITSIDHENKIVATNTQHYYKLNRAIWLKYDIEYKILDEDEYEWGFSYQDYENYTPSNEILSEYFIGEIDDVDKIIKLKDKYMISQYTTIYKIFHDTEKTDHIIHDSYSFDPVKYLRFYPLETIKLKLITKFYDNAIYVNKNLRSGHVGDILRYRLWDTYGYDKKIIVYSPSRDKNKSIKFNINNYLSNTTPNEVHKIKWNLVIDTINAQDKNIRLNDKITECPSFILYELWNLYGKKYTISTSSEKHEFNINNYINTTVSVSANFMIDYDDIKTKNNLYVIENIKPEYRKYLNVIWNKVGVNAILVFNGSNKKFNMEEYILNSYMLDTKLIIDFDHKKTIIDSYYVLKATIKNHTPDIIHELLNLVGNQTVVFYDPFIEKEYKFDVQKYIDNTRLDNIDYKYIIDFDNLNNTKKEYYVLLKGISHVPNNLIDHYREIHENNAVAFYNPDTDHLYHPSENAYLRDAKELRIKRSEILQNYLTWLRSMCGIYWKRDVTERVYYIDEPGTGMGVTRDFFTNLGIQIINDGFKIINKESGEGEYCSINQLEPIKPNYFKRSIEDFYMELGRIFAKSIKIDDETLGISLSNVILHKLVHKNIPTFKELVEIIKKDSKHYVEKFDAILNFKELFEDHYDKHLTDQIAQDYGIVIEFTKDGGPVTYDDINIVNSPLIDEFINGFYNVLPHNDFAKYKINDVTKLNDKLSGAFNLDNWMKQTRYTNNIYDEDDSDDSDDYSAPNSDEFEKVKEWFWIAVKKMTVEQQKLLLMFQSGYKHVIPNYNSDYTIVITHQYNKLFTSQTCFKKLVISNYESYEHLEKVLQIIVEHGVGFQTN